jgi:hypothetical protein
VYSVKASVFGGAGGGSPASCGCSTGYIGGHGGYASGIYAVTPGTGYSWSIGLGGAGVVDGRGGTGGTTSFGGVISATGGDGGLTNNGRGTAGAGASGTLTNKTGSYAPQPLGIGNSNATLPAANWTTDYNGGPGQAGAVGGLSGAILLEYIG